jgi:hypothetical protein
MITLMYHKSGVRVPDDSAEGWARKKVKAYKNEPPGTEVTLTLANGIVIDAFCVLIKEGVIDHNEVQISHDGFTYPMNIHGRPAIWPPGFAEVQNDLLLRLI